MSPIARSWSALTPTAAHCQAARLRELEKELAEAKHAHCALAAQASRAETEKNDMIAKLKKDKETLTTDLYREQEAHKRNMAEQGKKVCQT